MPGVTRAGVHIGQLRSLHSVIPYVVENIKEYFLGFFSHDSPHDTRKLRFGHCLLRAGFNIFFFSHSNPKYPPSGLGLGLA